MQAVLVAERTESRTRHTVDRLAPLPYSQGLIHDPVEESIPMRKILVPAFVLVALLSGCAHPTPPEGFGTTAPAPASTAATATNADQQQVCTQAKSVSGTQVALIKAKAAQAQAALGSGDQATLAQSIGELKQAASDWSAQLTQLSSKQISPQLRTVLTDGAATISTLANSSVPPPDAQSKLDAFTSKLNAACA
jgi:hypothetical protein